MTLTKITLSWLSVYLGILLLMFAPSCDNNGGAGPDIMPPAAVTDLSVGGSTETSITLTWTAPGDDGMTGRATEYDIRQSTSSGTGWDTMSQVIGVPAPKEAGQSESYEVTGLTPGTQYYFCLKSCDEGNWSGVSNLTSGMTETPCIDDGYEENDSLATAYDWTGGENDWITALQGDDDWYRIILTAPRVLIECQFSHIEGNIDIQLVNSSGTVVAQSRSTTDDESINIVVPMDDPTYYVRVFLGNKCNTYRLYWDDVAP